MATHSKNSAVPPVTLTIEKLVYGGAALAHYQGKAYFLSGGIPGETVTAKIESAKTHYCTATLLDILQPSPCRITPSCSSFGSCGGCQWQHIDYEHQLIFKAEILRDCFNRIGKLYDFPLSQPIPSSQKTRYRSRAVLRTAVKPLPVIGFYKQRKHIIAPMTDCQILENTLVKAVAICRALMTDDPDHFKPYSQLSLLASDSDETVLGLWHDDRNKKTIRFTCNVADTTFTEDPQTVFEVLDGLRFLRNTGGFYQINRAQNLAMIKKVLAFTDDVAMGQILDLFCGCGNFSLFLARRGAHVTGIDYNAATTHEARENARINGIDSCHFLTYDISRLDMAVFTQGINAVLLNPPRHGCTPQTLRAIIAAHPPVIVYISCSPATLARDLRVLTDAGYTIDAVQPFDMFPQTYHIETIVRLSK